jgi:hypothetical protein
LAQKERSTRNLLALKRPQNVVEGGGFRMTTFRVGFSENVEKTLLSASIKTAILNLLWHRLNIFILKDEIYQLISNQKN